MLLRYFPTKLLFLLLREALNKNPIYSIRSGCHLPTTILAYTRSLRHPVV